MGVLGGGVWESFGGEGLEVRFRSGEEGGYGWDKGGLLCVGEE